MVSVAAFLAATTAAIFASASADNTVAADIAQGLVATTESMAQGLYFRPPASLTSGDPTNTDAPFRRTPCPALNALANHGYLPRDGKNITTTQLRDVVMDKYNLDLALATLLVSVFPATPFDLNLLGTHNLVEHDASLVHADVYFEKDTSKIDDALLKDVLKRADSNGQFSVQTFGQIRKERLAASKANNPNVTFGATQVFLAFGESSLILNGFGNGTTETVDLATLTSFLKEEKIPSWFTKSPTQVTQAKLGATSAKIQAIANAA